MQATTACEAHDMLKHSRMRPDLVAQIVPSPFTLPFDATIQDIVRDQVRAVPCGNIVRDFQGLA